MASSIILGILAVSQLMAQQAYLDKLPLRSTPAKKSSYVAWQSEANTEPTTQSTNGLAPDPDSTTAPSSSSQTQESDTVPGTFFPGVLPSGESGEVSDCDMTGVENGLWEGCSPGNCCAVCGGGYCTPPLWYTEQGARVLARSRPRRVSLGQVDVQVTNPITGQPQIVTKVILNTRSINYDVAVGYNATIGRYLGRDAMDRDDFLEFTYWGMNTWVDSALARGTRLTDTTTLGRRVEFGSIFTDFPVRVGGFTRADLQTLTVNSEMHNWELNLRLRPRGRPDQLVLHPNGRWRRECQPGTYMSYLTGIRYMTIGDGAFWHSQGTINDNGVLHFITGDYDVLTENDLLGLQIGADLIFRRCKWSWGFRAKVGPYINFARNAQEIHNDPTGDPFASVFFNDRFTAIKQKAALIGEVGIEANYKFKPNLIGRAAYDFMWISGLALAPEQFQFTATPMSQINANGSIYSHGISLGLEWCW